MKFAVQVTHTVLHEVEAIARYIISQGSPRNAVIWVKELMRALSGLATFPEGWGLAIENRHISGYEIRQRVFGKYRILFTVQKQDVFVLHVRWAGRRSASSEDLFNSIKEMERMKGLLRNRSMKRMAARLK